MSVAIFAALKWHLGIIEAIIVIMSVGLSVDFVVHFGVGYIHTDSGDIERARRKVKAQYLALESADAATQAQTSSSNSFPMCTRTASERALFSISRNEFVPSAIQGTSGRPRNACHGVDLSSRLGRVHGCIYHIRRWLLDDVISSDVIPADGPISNDNK